MGAGKREGGKGFVKLLEASSQNVCRAEGEKEKKLIRQGTCGVRTGKNIRRWGIGQGVSGRKS